ncbi:hypothetical protein GCM10011609_87680 [Lentzea pudingi]|uniref:Integrase n=1 Tax=Lentzea pudingi TaxID=1789439 RepID=A0ABQ2IUZ7_9PSEU|nr:hypothetical protein [Lentzea pudingi]GGN30127.1 hypothetical protein GCM10011609_87680 [Lentzea pudingi]
MIDDGIPEIAQSLRLGHVMPDKIQETYSHVAASVEARLLQRLMEMRPFFASHPSDDSPR